MQLPPQLLVPPRRCVLPRWQEQRRLRARLPIWPASRHRKRSSDIGLPLGNGSTSTLWVTTPDESLSSSTASLSFVTVSRNTRSTLKARTSPPHSPLLLTLSGGFQLLHAVYAVETFLQNLRQRGCIFNIIFLKNLRDLCVPSTASADNAFKYQLARSIIIRHLVKSAPAPAEDGARHDTFEFEAVDSPECQEYLLTQRLHFVFCHEGDDRREKDAVQLRHLIYKFAARGISVAKINQAVFKSSKVRHTMLCP